MGAPEQVIAAAPANSAVATGRQQRIAAELEVAAAQANSAVVVEQIEAALEAAAAPFKGSAAGEIRQGARVSAVARAGRAAAGEDPAGAAEADPEVEVVEVGAGRNSVEYPVLSEERREKSDEWCVSSVEWNSLDDPRPSYLIWWRKK
ncbi:MAG: hypothetical protein ACREMY_12605 [bacterium]